jgi:hypothetical protein
MFLGALAPAFLMGTLSIPRVPPQTPAPKEKTAAARLHASARGMQNGESD